MELEIVIKNWKNLSAKEISEKYNINLTKVRHIKRDLSLWFHANRIPNEVIAEILELYVSGKSIIEISAIVKKDYNICTRLISLHFFRKRTGRILTLKSAV